MLIVSALTPESCVGWKSTSDHVAAHLVLRRSAVAACASLNPFKDRSPKLFYSSPADRFLHSMLDIQVHIPSSCPSPKLHANNIHFDSAMHNRPSTLPLRSSTSTSAAAPASKRDGVYREFYNNSTAPRIKSEVVLVEALRKQYPSLHLTIISAYRCNFIAYAAAGHARATPIDAGSFSNENLKHREYKVPARRLNGESGYLYDEVEFGKWMYKWEGKEYILYSINGSESLYEEPMTYILGSTPIVNDELLLAACAWQTAVHDSVLVFDSGYWQYSSELWQSIQKASWDDVILDADMKKSIIGEVNKFFDSRERYEKLRVPWKRGIIFHGPPGNGKTISIKAMMHSLYEREAPIPTLYVRSLASYGGPEYAISQIFSEARRQAPCFLIFEDLDSIVSDDVRSYFLNEVDGLQSNDGILMVGSTNHLEQLDPGISKRPSRFDRKYLFPNPDIEERVQYCEFWRRKLDDNDDVEFPEVLCKAIASITKGFSFAYIQEAFVAALLAIANGDASDYEGNKVESCFRTGDKRFWHPSWHPRGPCCETREAEMRMLSKMEEEEDLEKFVLWREIKKVVKTLREEMGAEKSLGSLAEPCDFEDRCR